MSSRILIVAGSPGAGKTTLLNDKSIKSKYKVVTLGDIMRELGMRERVIRNRDEIRYLKTSANNRLRDEAIRKLSAMKGDIILDTHASVEQHGKFFPGLFFSRQMWRKVVGLVYLDATNIEIAHRRMLDRTRKREHESNEWLDRQRIINMSVLSYYSAALNIPLYVIDNRNGELKQTVKEFLVHAKDAFGK